MNDATAPPGGAPREGDRFANFDGILRTPGDFWRWRREHRAGGLPRPPAEGYAAFARRWRLAPDFSFGLDSCVSTSTQSSSTARPVVWWLGHATLLLRLGALHVITDPHFGSRA